MNFDWKKIEEKWQRRWAEAKIFETDPIVGKKKFFLTVAFPLFNLFLFNLSLSQILV